MNSQNQIPEKLSLMLTEVNNNEGFRKFIKKIVQKMNFDKKNILNLTLEKVQSLFINVRNKLNHVSFIDQNLKNLQTSIWLQNQLRIFVYILCTYLFLNKITINDLKAHDFSFLRDLFPNKKQEYLEYQVKLLNNKKNPKWTKEQSQLFREIMTQNQESNRWNFIAKQLFIRSSKKFFKTPKQCRQRWINHEDPKKIKGNWQKFEDISLLTSVSFFGKKWTQIAHKLNDTRTQNSVKNRYNSLIKAAKRQYGHDRSQQSLIKKILSQKYEQAQNFVQSNGEKKSQQSQQQKQKIETAFQRQQCQISGKNIDLHFACKIDIQHNNLIEKQQCNNLISSNQLQQNSQPKDEDFNFMLEESDQLQNVEWNGQQSHSGFNQAFYFIQGNFCFDDSQHL